MKNALEHEDAREPESPRDEQERTMPAYTPAQAPSTEREYPTLGYE